MQDNMKNLPWIFALIFLSVQVQAQIITGRVTNQTSAEPVPFANVFFANTTNGTATDENGYFRLPAKAEGRQTLVVSMVGFQSYSREVELKKGENLQLQIMLNDDLKELDEVTVKADTTGWQDNFYIFRQQFIGKMKGAGDCKIKNAKSLYFYYDPRLNQLIAHAKVPLIIENEHLGYRVEYWLEHFVADFREKTTHYFGYPRFEEMQPKNKRQAKKWRKNRIKTYQGSLMELVRGIYSKANLDSMGWDVRQLHYEKNTARPDDEFLRRKVMEHINNEDSAMYYSKLLRQPKQIAVVSRDLFDFQKYSKPKSDGSLQLDYDGYLNATYMKENQAREYYSFMQDYRAQPQNTIIQLLAPPYFLYTNGFMYDTKNYMLGGYLGWYEKLATQLPLDFNP